MASALITCTTPRSMATEDAMAWLERRAEQLRRAEPVEDITVRELRPRRGNPIWLVHVVLRSENSEEWKWLLGDLTRDLRRLRRGAMRLGRHLRDLLLSIRARLAASDLDAELAAGADPGSDPVLGRRAHQLSSPRTRRRLAQWLEKTVWRADESPLPGLAVPVQWSRVAGSRETLLALAERLRDGQPVDGRGVAMVQSLLTDAYSPLHFEHASYSLPSAARRALLELDFDGPDKASQELHSGPAAPAVLAG